MTQEEKDNVFDIPYDTEVETNKLPRYTKWEIENRLYMIIDNETIFPLNEDRGEAFKLINKLLESLD